MGNEEIVNNVIETPEPAPEVAPQVQEGSQQAASDPMASAQEFIGRQANEIGQLRAELNQLKSTPPHQEEPTDYGQILREINERVNNGELDYSDALLETAEITRQQTIAEARQAMQAQLEERDAAEYEKKFLAENPDFIRLRDSGAISAAMKSDPMIAHDPLSAYYFIQNQELRASSDAAVKAAAEAAYNKAREDISRGAKSAQPASYVSGNSGQTINQVNPDRPMTRKEKADLAMRNIGIEPPD